MSFRYEAFEKQHFLEFLKQGLFDEDINEVVRRFSFYEPLFQFELVKYLRERKPGALSLKVLSKALSCSQNDARHILNGEGRIFKIVLSGRETSETCGKVIRALVIPGTSKLITNNERIKKSLSVVKKFYGKPFAVFFEEEFSGKSFMLPLAISLCVKNIPEHLIFTGKIDARGNIFEVEEVDRKLSIAKKKGLKLISPSQVGDIKTIKAFLDKEEWNLPFYITSESCEEIGFFLPFVPEEELSEELPFLKGLKVFYDISIDELCLVTGQLKEGESWEKACKEFYKKVWNLKNKLSGKKIFHFGIRGAASLGMALGILWGSQEPFVIYHYQAGKYHPVKVLNPREIKEKVLEYKNISWSFEEGGEELVIVLKFAHHELFADVKEFAKTRIENPSFLLVEHRASGNIPPEEFKMIVKETASLIQNIRKERSFRRFHFFFSCPVAIAFMLGVAFGHYAEGVLYNYQKEEQIYIPAVELKILRKIRESGVRF